MTWIERFQEKSTRYWDDIEAFFDSLPGRLYRQGRLLRNNLAVHFSDSGFTRDILTRTGDYPPFSMPGWLIADHPHLKENQASSLEEHLVPANLYIFAQIYTQQSILNPHTGFDSTYIHLAGALARQADWHFQQILAAASPFWEFHQEFWEAYSEAALLEAGDIPDQLAAVTQQNLLQVSDNLAPYKLIPTAIALEAGAEAHISKLQRTFDSLHAGIKILQDLSSLVEDLQQRKFTYPVLLLMTKLGMTPLKQYSKDGTLAAIRFTDTLSEVIQDCRVYLEQCHQGAGELGLAALQNYTDQLEQRVDQVEGRLSAWKVARSAGSAAAWSPDPERRPGQRPLDQVIQMAQGYLLSDLSFRESWEVHRRGLAGSPEVTARFPAGLILEILCSYGFELNDPVDKLTQFIVENHFSYYAHPDLPFADADTLGLMLRLMPYASDPGSLRKELDTSIDWMVKSVPDTGRIPVWLNQPAVEKELGSSGVRLLGEGCGAIEASLLIGLYKSEWQQHQTLIVNSCRQLLERFIDHGPAITVNYPPTYCLWRINQLLEVISLEQIPDDLGVVAARARQVYPDYLIRTTEQSRITPQEAALLILASLNFPAEDLFSRSWVTNLMKSQRADGSWYGEPIFFVPNRGEITSWHSSHLLTSAHCYHALKGYSDSQHCC
jgi:hypothetical protein